METLHHAFHTLVGSQAGPIAWWQMSIRAMLIFFAGLVLARLAGRRAFGKYTALDIIFAVIIGSSLSRALTGNAPFLPTLAACGMLVVLHWLTVEIARRSPELDRFLKGSALPLIRDGRLDRRAMARAGVSDGDIEEALRQHGRLRVEEVKLAMLERNGDISLIARPPADGGER